MSLQQTVLRCAMFTYLLFFAFWSSPTFAQPIAPDPDMAIYGGGRGAIDDYARQWDAYNDAQFDAMLRRQSDAVWGDASSDQGKGPSSPIGALLLALLFGAPCLVLGYRMQRRNMRLAKEGASDSPLDPAERGGAIEAGSDWEDNAGAVESQGRPSGLSKGFGVGVVLVVLISVIALLWPSPSIESLATRADQAIAEGDWKEAERLARRALPHVPEGEWGMRRDLNYLLGIALHGSAEYEDAISALTIAIDEYKRTRQIPLHEMYGWSEEELVRRLSIAYYMRAESHLACGRPRSALRDAEASLRLDRHPATLWMCAKAHADLGSARSAARMFGEVLRHPDASIRQRATAGDYLREHGSVAKPAIERDFAERAEHDPWAAFLLGRVHERVLRGSEDVGASTPEWLPRSASTQWRRHHDLMGDSEFIPSGREAVRWYEVAAEAGLIVAKNNLALSLVQGEFVEAAYERGLLLFEELLDSPLPGDSTRAKAWLGYLHREGLGVDRDCRTAMRYLREAATEDSLWAMELLGESYEQGECVRKNRTKAREWLERAAARGSSWAEGRLARSN